MDQYSALSEQPKMFERLLAHARMCRQVADECGNKELAADSTSLHWNVSKRQLNLRNDARLVLL
jgi:hypothetical protein